MARGRRKSAHPTNPCATTDAAQPLFAHLFAAFARAGGEGWARTPGCWRPTRRRCARCRRRGGLRQRAGAHGRHDGGGCCLRVAVATPPRARCGGAAPEARDTSAGSVLKHRRGAARAGPGIGARPGIGAGRGLGAGHDIVAGRRVGSRHGFGAGHGRFGACCGIGARHRIRADHGIGACPHVKSRQ